MKKVLITLFLTFSATALIVKAQSQSLNVRVLDSAITEGFAIHSLGVTYKMKYLFVTMNSIGKILDTTVVSKIFVPNENSFFCTTYHEITNKELKSLRNLFKQALEDSWVNHMNGNELQKKYGYSRMEDFAKYTNDLNAYLHF